MVHKFVADRIKQPWAVECTESEWLELAQCLAQEARSQETLFYQTLSAHSGVPLPALKSAFNTVLNTDIDFTEQECALQTLKELEHAATLKIKAFQEYNYFKTLDLKSIHISRTEWLTLIYRFNQENRSFVTPGFFLHNLSDMRKITLDALLENESLRRSQPQRSVKAESEHKPNLKRTYDYYKNDQGANPLILEDNTVHPELQNKIQKTGARCVPLIPASPEPERAYEDVRYTPGHTKARALCSIGGATFFKHISPYVNKVADGRADVRQVLQENVQNNLPKISYEKAESIEFTATLESLIRRQNCSRRRSQNAIKNASASDVFRAHGIEIAPTQNRAHHWAHLIAFFLGGDQGYANLIPSTAAANYNTLESIELFIKKLLTEEGIEAIFIKVEPIYTHKETLIPDMLIYSLSWASPNKVDLCQETFHINPQSYQRFTKSMHEAILLLRAEEHESEFKDENKPEHI